MPAPTRERGRQFPPLRFAGAAPPVQVNWSSRAVYSRGSRLIAPMSGSSLVVVAETPSLGRSVLDLLESGGHPGRLVFDLPSELPPDWVRSSDPVVVVACNSPFCRTARRWASGEFPRLRLVVVGSRDPLLATLPRVEVVPLPLHPATLLLAVAERRGSPEPGPRLLARPS